MCGVAGLALLFTLLMIRRLMIAIACLKVASQAIAAMPMILFSPIIPLIMNVVFMAWAVLVATYLYASGKIERNTETETARSLSRGTRRCSTCPCTTSSAFSGRRSSSPASAS